MVEETVCIRLARLHSSYLSFSTHHRLLLHLHLQQIPSPSRTYLQSFAGPAYQFSTFACLISKNYPLNKFKMQFKSLFASAVLAIATVSAQTTTGLLGNAAVVNDNPVGPSLVTSQVLTVAQ